MERLGDLEPNTCVLLGPRKFLQSLLYLLGWDLYQIWKKKSNFSNATLIQIICIQQKILTQTNRTTPCKIYHEFQAKEKVSVEKIGAEFCASRESCLPIHLHEMSEKFELSLVRNSKNVDFGETIMKPRL